MHREQENNGLYKLLVVDDEEEVREGMKDFIDWPGMGFELLGTAENGKEALARIASNRPDVVLCDINMPVMDGLQLAEEVGRLCPQIKIVFLTGYDEFEYAQQAIRLNAEDFLLKPVTPQDIEGLFLSLREKLERENEQQRDLMELRRKLRESVPILRERYLHQWLSGTVSFSDIAARLDSIGIPVYGRLWACLVMEPDGKEDHPFSADPDLMTFAIANVSEEWIRANIGPGYVFVNARNQPTAVVSVADGPDKESRLVDSAYALQRMIERILKISVTIGVGSIVAPERAASGYRDAQQALEYRFLLEGGKVLYIKDVERNSGEPSTGRLLDIQDRIVSRLRVSGEEEAGTWVREYFSELSSCGLSPEICKVYVVELVTLLSKAYHEYFASMFDQDGGAFHPILLLSRCDTLQQMRDFVEEWCREIAGRIGRRRNHFYEETVEKAIAFMKENYANEKCSIQMLCDHLYISPSYFSLIFKRITGETFVEYLTGIRLEKARELLRTTSLKAYEIAELTGFSNTHYFSMVFKKGVGVTPSEYRKLQ